MWCSEFPVPAIPGDSAPEKEEKMTEYWHIGVHCCTASLLIYLRARRKISSIWQLLCEWEGWETSSKSGRRGEQDEVCATHFHYLWIQRKAPCGHEIWLYQNHCMTSHDHLTPQPNWYTEAKTIIHKGVHTLEGRWFNILHQNNLV